MPDLADELEMFLFGEDDEEWRSSGSGILNDMPVLLAANLLKQGDLVVWYEFLIDSYDEARKEIKFVLKTASELSFTNTELVEIQLGDYMHRVNLNNTGESYWVAALDQIFDDRLKKVKRPTSVRLLIPSH